ncbi:MAG: hypothetical protein HOV94_34170 [Saccharothrix sp.]|nr:hypothetical protein [Saccharothrix sp.]
MPLLTAQTALAHDTSASINVCGNNNAERCGYGGVTNSHTRVYSCDTYADNAGFRTEYQLRSGATGYVDDANGSSSGCSGIYPGSSSNPITAFRVIWKAAGGWVYSGWYGA